MLWDPADAPLGLGRGTVPAPPGWHELGYHAPSGASEPTCLQ
jgi:hypothetical protein